MFHARDSKKKKKERKKKGPLLNLLEGFAILYPDECVFYSKFQEVRNRRAGKNVL